MESINGVDPIIVADPDNAGLFAQFDASIRALKIEQEDSLRFIEKEKRDDTGIGWKSRSREQSPHSMPRWCWDGYGATIEAIGSSARDWKYSAISEG
jgi:hypothetical protein